jgi:hypothetical protein
MGQSSSWEDNILTIVQEIPRLLMETEVLLPCANKPAIGYHYEPDVSSQQPHIIFI